jgi:DNA-binding MarR family transcriptional regulator
MDAIPLNETETRAWRSFVMMWQKGLPRFDRTFRQHGLIHIEYGIMAVLAEQPGGGMCAGDLADLAGVTSSRLSHRLNAMEQRGDITRRVSTTDARMIEVAITDQGRERITAVADEHTADIRRLMFEPLDEEQTRQLADALMVIASKLTDHPFLTRYAETATSPTDPGGRG